MSHFIQPSIVVSRRRGRLLSLAIAACAAFALLFASVASADSSTTLTAVGTSDVSDSGLMQNVIEPEFHQQYPQYTFKYDGTATLAAITAAENGSDGASLLIVHAASLENQFVADGWSYQNQPGYAIWTNDFVMLGPSSDPAGVGANASHNMVQSFEDIADSGINGDHVTFVSRGGGPGTTVEEHEIWALVDQDPNKPSGLLLCTVPASLGGGMTPIESGSGTPAFTTDGAACPGSALPGSGDPDAGSLPDWYVTTGLTQGPNVLNANTCSGYPSGSDSCYVLTDRGTYDYLLSGLDPAGTVSALSKLTYQDTASAPGGSTLLVNYFHAYIINPDATVEGGSTKEPVNLTAAQDFIKFVTSPQLQSQLKYYLDNTSDSEGAPFVADASPTITATGFPATDAAGKSVTVTGTLQNSQNGYPALSGQTVSIDEVLGGVPVAVASGTTDSNGGFSVSFVPPSSGTYQVSSGQLTALENGTLDPQYFDTLSPAASTPVSMNVQGSVAITSAKGSAGGATLAGTVAPAAPSGNATVSVLARPAGSSGKFTQVGGGTLSAGQSTYAVNAGLRPGKWQLEVSYQDPDQLLAGTSSASNVTVPAASTSVTLTKAKVSNGKLTVSGRLSQAPSGSAATVELFALQTVAVSKAKSKKTIREQGVRAGIASASFKRIGKASVKSGKATFTIKAKLARGYKWVLQLEFTQKGQPTSYSKLSTIAVH